MLLFSERKIANLQYTRISCESSRYGVNCRIYLCTWRLAMPPFKISLKNGSSRFFYCLSGFGQKFAIVEKMPTLNWIGKDAVINHHHDVPFKTLDQKYTFGAEKSENKIIHGDNLEALKALLPEYEGKIKCIYIDPPYNTGNENWVYNDNVNSPRIRKWLGQVVGKEAEDLTRHDKWLCMMYPRLKLLHQLLSDDGAIFISIDDNEQANLKLICDEIFGSGNFIDTLHWKRKKQPSFLAKHTAKVMEYILVYAKNWEQLEKLSIDTLSDATKKVVNITNQMSIRHLKKGVRVKIGQSGVITAGIYTIKTMSVEYLNDVVYDNGITLNEVDVRALFSVSQEKINAYIDENLLFITANYGLRRDVSNTEKNNKKAITDLLLDWGDNQDSEKELKDIFGESLFNYSKPQNLISNLIKSLETSNSIILDSFAGSGTTAHAVLNLNKQDGGNRKFILVEMEDYAETITAERVRRVISGYGRDAVHRVSTEGTGGAFTYYELGEPMMNGDYLNENQPIEKIREYIWYSETHVPYCRDAVHRVFTDNAGNPYHLGNHNNAGYYFYYEKNTTTTLDKAFLNTISQPADQYIIYADNCLLSDEFMRLNNIVFKKIPRDIRKF